MNANETLKQRADRLFAEGRWAEAAAVYRELLRRNPRNDDADRWRRASGRRAGGRGQRAQRQHRRERKAERPAATQGAAKAEKATPRPSGAAERPVFNGRARGRIAPGDVHSERSREQRRSGAYRQAALIIAITQVSVGR